MTMKKQIKQLKIFIARIKSEFSALKPQKVFLQKLKFEKVGFMKGSKAP